jgi:hypothetical protein
MGPDRFMKNSNADFIKSHGKLGAMIDLTLSKSLRDDWYACWPEARAYHAWAGRVPGGDRAEAFVQEPITRAWRGGLWFSAIANTPFQSLTAAGAKNAIWKVVEACCSDASASPLRGAGRPCSFIHDELLLYLPEEAASELAEEQCRLQLAGFQELHPDVPVYAEPAIMRRWCKAAEKKMVDGRLVPWDDTTPYAGSSDDPMIKKYTAQEAFLFKETVC